MTTDKGRRMSDIISPCWVPKPSVSLWGAPAAFPFTTGMRPVLLLRMGDPHGHVTVCPLEQILQC